MDAERAVKLVETLLQRFKGATLDMLEEVLVPLQVPLDSVGKEVRRYGTHYGVSFSIKAGTEHPTITRGRTGKVVPKELLDGLAGWEELLKARIHEAREGKADGELHAINKTELIKRLNRVRVGDILELDRFGVTAKLESALTEAVLVAHGLQRGYRVTRMPEDIARHLGTYYHFDFLFEKGGVTKRVESKSLWGTDTRKARLIHSKSASHVTSSAKFKTQDIFAVNLWLRTGTITDIAFARSIAKDENHPYGLPMATKEGGGALPEYVHQNPDCEIGDGVWFGSIDDVWDLP